MVVSTAFGGCNQEEELDNLCLFLKDKQSCYQEFLTTIGSQCTMTGITGVFETRDSLEKCTFSGASSPGPNIVTQVTFDPPIELTKLPYTGGNVKLTINGTDCGMVEFGEKDKLAVALDVYPQLTDPAVACETSGTQFCGSSYSNTPVAPESINDSSTLISTKCPDGTTFKFDRFQIDQQCADQAAVFPEVKFVIMPNGVNKEGSVTLAIKYTSDKTETYVNCTIPPALPACANGEKDGLETDIDCGGSTCMTRCDKDQSCISDSDCKNGLCSVVGGIKKCN